MTSQEFDDRSDDLTPRANSVHARQCLTLQRSAFIYSLRRSNRHRSCVLARRQTPHVAPQSPSVLLARRQRPGHLAAGSTPISVTTALASRQVSRTHELTSSDQKRISPPTVHRSVATEQLKRDPHYSKSDRPLTTRN